MMSKIVERLRRKVFHGPTMEASHTKTLEWEAADRITALEAVVAEALTKVENDRTMWTEEWLIWAQDARAALTPEPRT